MKRTIILMVAICLMAANVVWAEEAGTTSTTTTVPAMPEATRLAWIVYNPYHHCQREAKYWVEVLEDNIPQYNGECDGGGCVGYVQFSTEACSGEKCPPAEQLWCTENYRVPDFRARLASKGWPVDKIELMSGAGQAGAFIIRVKSPNTVEVEKTDGTAKVYTKPPGGERQLQATIRDGEDGAPGPPGPAGFHSVSIAFGGAVGNPGSDSDITLLAPEGSKQGKFGFAIDGKVNLTFRLYEFLLWDIGGGGYYLSPAAERRHLGLFGVSGPRFEAIENRLAICLGFRYDAVSLVRRTDLRLYRVLANGYGGELDLTVRLVGPLWVDAYGVYSLGTLNPYWLAGVRLRVQLGKDMRDR